MPSVLAVVVRVIVQAPVGGGVPKHVPPTLAGCFGSYSSDVPSPCSDGGPATRRPSVVLRMGYLVVPVPLSSRAAVTSAWFENPSGTRSAGGGSSVPK